jgi:hypothetical protein
MNKYVCHYEFEGHVQKCFNDKYAIQGVFDYKDGFWVDSNFNFTKGSDGRYWIPPSRIYYVGKQVIEDEKGEGDRPMTCHP